MGPGGVPRSRDEAYDHRRMLSNFGQSHPRVGEGGVFELLFFRVSFVTVTIFLVIYFSRRCIMPLLAT